MSETDPSRDLFDALGRQMRASREASLIERRDWTTDQWCADAHRLMNEPDGAITSLVNGHVMALLRKVQELRERLVEHDPLVIAVASWAQDDHEYNREFLRRTWDDFTERDAFQEPAS